MNSTDSELRLRLVKYIDKYEGKEEMREVLKKTCASSRYEVLISCKGASGRTAPLRSAVQGDIRTLKRMLVGLNSQQIYQVMKIRSDDGEVPLHQAAAKGYTDILMYILCNLSPKDRFNTLKVKSCGGTPAHWAAYQKKPETLQLLLTSVTPEQQGKLLAIESDGKNTVRDFITLPDLSYDYFSAKELSNAQSSIRTLESQVETQAEEQQKAKESVKELETRLEAQGLELSTAQQKGLKQESLLQAQGETISQQAAELQAAKQKGENMESLLQAQGDTISQQAAELQAAKHKGKNMEALLQAQGDTLLQQAAALQRLTDRQEEMQRETQRALRELAEFNRRCFSTADTGDQEHEF